MTVIIAKNQTAGALSLTQLSVPDREIPASGQVTLTDWNSLNEIQDDEELLSYVNDGYVLIDRDGVLLSQADSTYALTTVVLIEDGYDLATKNYVDYEIALIDLDGYVVGPASATDTALVRFDGTTGKLVQNSGITVDGSDNITNAGTFNGVTVEAHASRHESGGADEISLTGLIDLDGYVVGPASATDTAITLYDGTTGKLVKSSGITVDGSDNITNAGTFNGVTVESHASRHEVGGADQIDLTGLIDLDGYVTGPASATDTALVRFDGTTGKLVQNSGITVDGSDNITNAGTYNGVTVEAHASRHESGGADEISLTGLIDLDGYVVGPASATDTAIVRFDGTTGKLVQNSGITVDGSDNITNAGTYNGVTVEAHASRHEAGGADQIDLTGLIDLDGYVTGPASATDTALVRFDGTTGKLVQNSGITVDGSDNITNAGTYNGVTVEAHASRHEFGGADQISLTGLIDLDGYATIAYVDGYIDNYLPLDGSRAMTGDLDLGSNDIANPGVNTFSTIYTAATTGTRGDLLYRDVDNWTVLAAGDDGYVLTTHGTTGDPAWEPKGSPALHAYTHENGGTDEISVTGLSGELADAQKVSVSKNSGASVGTRSNLNFIEGSNVTLTIADDAGNSEVDITIATTGGSVDLDGYVVGPASATDTAITLFDGTTGKLVKSSGITVDGSDNITNAGTFNGVTVEAHASRHEFGGADQIDLTGLIDLDGYVVGPASATDTALVRYDGTTGKLVQNSGITVDGSDNITNAGTYNGVTVEAHASRHESGGADEISLTGLIDLDGYVVGPASATDTAIVRFDGTTGKLVQNSGITVDGSDNITNAGTYNGVTVEAHASRHEAGGADEISLTGLIDLDGYVVGPASATDTAITLFDGTTGKLVQSSGITVDGSDNITNAGTYNGVTVEAHAARHEFGGADQINLTGLIDLDGYVVGPASATDTAITLFDGTTGKLVQSSGITVDGSDNITNAGTYNGVTVEAHASRHEFGGADEISLTGLIDLDGYVVGPASATDTALVRFDGTTGKLVQNSGITVDGSDNITNAGTYNGVTVEAHASRHEFGGADQIDLTGLIDLDGYVIGPASATDTAITLFDGTTGKLVQSSGITVDGSDNITNAGTYNGVTVEAHASRHEFGGADQIDLTGLIDLDGYVVGPASATDTALVRFDGTTGKLVQNSGITVDGSDNITNAGTYNGVTVEAHASRHEFGGADQIDLTGLIDLDGYVVGPASATDTAIVRFDGTTGKLVQDSGVTIDASDNLDLNSGDITSPGTSTFSNIYGAATDGTWGDVLYRGQTNWVRLSASDDGYVLTTRGTGANPEWYPAPGAGGGEANLGSNIGTDGYGVYDSKSSVTLRFRNIDVISNILTINYDATDHDIDIGVNQSNIDHGSIGGLADDDHTQYILANGTRAFTGPVQGSTDLVLLAQDGYVKLNSDMDADGYDIINIEVATNEVEYDDGYQSTSSMTLDANLGNFQTVEIGANVTSVTMVPPLIGVGRFQVRIVQSASYTITGWPASVLWPGGTDPTITTGANSEDIITFFWNGTNWYGIWAGDFG